MHHSIGNKIPTIWSNSHSKIKLTVVVVVDQLLLVDVGAGDGSLCNDLQAIIIMKKSE